MSMMDVCGPVYCPECPPERFKRNDKVFERRPVLECVEGNYSGCGEDIALCRTCGKAYSISFTIDEIKRVPDWDIDIEAEKATRIENLAYNIKGMEGEITKKQEEIKKKKEELERLTKWSG